jgi:hypothetical protein
MRIEVIPNFATNDEIKELNDWAELGVINRWLDVGISKRNVIDKRVTSRFYPNRYHYPEVALSLSKRVRKHVGIDLYPLIEGHGRDGIVVSYTYPGDDVYSHKDPKSIDGMDTLRCNILTQKSDSGGILFVEGHKIDIEVGDLHCYLVSEHEHWATEVEGNTPRIMWMFGAHVPAEDWNSGKIKVQQ